MKRVPLLLIALLSCAVLIGADGCSSDPNVEGAKLDLRNKDYDRALENLNAALSKNPDNAEALAMKGNVLRELAFETPDIEKHSRLISEMVEAYDRAAALEYDVVFDKALAYSQEFDLGIRAFNKGADDESMFMSAVRYFQNTSVIAPDSVGPHVNRGYSLLRTGDPNSAAEPLRKAIELGDTDTQTYILLSDIYVATDRAEEAVALLEKADAMSPGDADVQTWLLNAYQQAGMTDQAMKRYEQNIATDPDNKLYRYNYGSLLLGAEQYEDAIVQLQRATEIDPMYANAHYNLGAAYQNMAVAYNDQINEIDDNLRANRANLSNSDIDSMEAQMDALAEQKRGSFASAIPHLEKAKSLSETEGEDTTSICVALYTAYVQTNQLEAAQAVASCAGFDESN